MKTASKASKTGNKSTLRSVDQVIPATASFYKQLVESIEEYCVFTMDTKGFITSWNVGAENITGFKEDEIIGKHGEIIFVPEDRIKGEHIKELERALSEGRAVNERWHLRKNKTRFWGSGLVFPLKDDNDKHIGFTKVMRDLTDRRNREKDLKDSQLLSNSIFDSSPECVKILDLDGNLLRMNKTGLSIMEIDDFCIYEGKSWLEFWQDDHLKAAKAAIREAKNGGTGSFRGFTPTAKGNPKWWEVTVTPIRTADNKIRQLLSVSRDVTHAKQQEDRLQNLVHELEIEKNKLINVFDKAPAFLGILSGENHVFEMANRSFYNLVGERDIIGKTFLQALPELKGHGFVEIMNRVYSSGKSYIGKELRAHLVRKPKAPAEERYVNLVYQPVKDGRGRITGLYLHGYDVTEEVQTRKIVEQTQEALKESEERLKHLADSMPQMVWTATADGKIDYHNKKWYEYTGYTAAGDRKEIWSRILHPDDVPGFLDTWNEALAKGEPYETEYRFIDRRNPGEYRWFLGRALPIKDARGKVIKWIGTSTDIQELKQLQSQKDDFLAIASHELKTPVTSIKAYGQVLETMLRSKGDTASADMLKRMDLQVNKLTNLIADLLDVTKIQAGRLQLNKTEFDFNEMVTEVVTDLQRTISTHKIITKFGKIRPVVADRDRLAQVVVNFISNAVKYSPTADKLIVRTVGSSKNAKLCVEDFGIGIPADHKDEVFGRFYRITGDKQITYPGLGLGLFIASEIIKRQSGEIWVESTVGQGSTFCFTIPYKA
jgi:PAS domain S-box-containing protein